MNVIPLEYAEAGQRIMDEYVRSGRTDGCWKHPDGDIKKCHFCGYDVCKLIWADGYEWEGEKTEFTTYCFVHCLTCDAKGPIANCEETAIERWNGPKNKGF